MWLLLQSHRDASVLSVGVHSPKVTLLSWARQIGVSEELRMAQGHHRQFGGKVNVALYGRDDVHPAFQLQLQSDYPEDLCRLSSGYTPFTGWCEACFRSPCISASGC